MNEKREASVNIIGCFCCGGFGFLRTDFTEEERRAVYMFSQHTDPIKTHIVKCDQMASQNLHIIFRKAEFEGIDDEQ